MGVALILLSGCVFRRWQTITAGSAWGRWALQPSELAKPAMVIFLAFFVTLRARAINTRYTLLPAALAVGLVTSRGGGGRSGNGRGADGDGGRRVLRGRSGIAVLLDRCWRWRRAALCFSWLPSLTGWRASCITSIPSYKLVDRIDSQGRVEDISEQVADLPRHQLSGGAIEDRGGRGRAGGARVDAGQTETALSSRGAHRLYLRRGERGAGIDRGCVVCLPDSW